MELRTMTRVNSSNAPPEFLERRGWTSLLGLRDAIFNAVTLRAARW